MVIFLIIVICVLGIALFAEKDENSSAKQNKQLENAHRILLELEATDKVMNILTLDLRKELKEYMDKVRKNKKF